MKIYNYIIFILLLFIFAVLAGSGCRTGGQKPAQAPSAVPVLRVGAVPAESKDKTRDQFAKFMKYLERKTGRSIELYVADSYDGIIEQMKRGELDIAWYGPFSYVIAADTARARVFAVDDNTFYGTSYHSVIIVQPESDIRRLEDLKGHSLAFVDKSSTSGYLIPRMALKKQGIDSNHDFNSTFLGSHDASVLAVRKRQVDAAAVSDAILRSLQQKGIVGERDFRILWQSEPIPTSAWAYREGLPAELVHTIRQAFLTVAAEDREALGMYGDDLVKGFAPAEDSQYDGIRNTARELDLEQK